MRRAAIVAPVRTPVGTFGGAIKALSAADLATTVLRAVIERAAVDAAQIDEWCSPSPTPIDTMAGLETMCIGGGQGLAAVFEAVAAG
jgi:acetyl-CoA C-acetyltransferase